MAEPRFYNSDDVDRYVAGLHAHIARLNAELHALRPQTAGPASALLADASQRTIGRALLRAQWAADHIAQEARQEADRLLEAAGRESGDLLENARRTCSELVDAARQERDELLRHAAATKAVEGGDDMDARSGGSRSRSWFPEPEPVDERWLAPTVSPARSHPAGSNGQDMAWSQPAEPWQPPPAWTPSVNESPAQSAEPGPTIQPPIAAPPPTGAPVVPIEGGSDGTPDQGSSNTEQTPLRRSLGRKGSHAPRHQRNS